MTFKALVLKQGPDGTGRTYLQVLGTDVAGTFEARAAARHAPGDKVVLQCVRLGEAHTDGFAKKARVNANWLVPLPDGLTMRTAMVVRTAGMTEMLARMFDQMKYGASAAALAFAGGVVLPALVVAFLLCGGNLPGIDSVMQPSDSRQAAWAGPVKEMPINRPEAMIAVAPQYDPLCLGPEFLAAKIMGRTLIGQNA